MGKRQNPNNWGVIRVRHRPWKQVFSMDTVKTCIHAQRFMSGPYI